MVEEKKRKPVLTLRTGVAPGVQLAVWGGENGHTFSISKSYKDKSGTWKQSGTFFKADLVALIPLALRALEFADGVRAEEVSAAKSKELSDDEEEEQF